MQEKTTTLQHVEELIRLVRQGDASSLASLRKRLGRTLANMASLMGITPGQLESWETGTEKPVPKQLAIWKLRLSDCVDSEISVLLKTQNMDVVHQFWELYWQLYQ